MITTNSKDKGRIIKSENNKALYAINTLINSLISSGQINNEDISDCYHTFGELYDIRKVYNAALFNAWGKGIYNQNGEINTRLPKYDVHKSLKHNDGELCFGGGWFIVVAMLPSGQVSNHYKVEDWDLFQIPEADKAKYPFDGHTTQDVIDRIKSIL